MIDFNNIQDIEQKEDLLQRNNLRNNPFAVPDRYFEALEDKLHLATAGHAPDGRWGATWRALSAYASLAAAFLLVFGIGWATIRLTSRIGKQEVVAAQNQEEPYFEDSLYEHLENVLYADAIEEAYSNGADVVIENVSIKDTDVYQEAVEEYIENVPTSSIAHLLAEEIEWQGEDE